MTPKLVRDLIPDLIAQRGARPITHVASDAEYATRLVEKLTEEVEEFRTSGDAEELADTLEVIYAIAESRGVTRAELEEIRVRKARTAGAFANRIVLDASNPSN